MLLMLVVAWVVVLPAVVVAGLFVASSVLGRRARRSGALEATGLAREYAGLAARMPERGDDADKPSAPKRRRVGAAY